MSIDRPEIFKYSDYRTFLKDWLVFKKASQSKFSLRGLSRQAGLASGYLPMVTGGKRELSQAALSKLIPFLGLNPAEQSFFENLLVLGISDSHEARVIAIERMQDYKKYQTHNQKDNEVYTYLSHWYYVAIREMADLAGFQLEAEWIQSKLNYSVPLKDIKDAIEFLKINEYLKINEKGEVIPPEKSLNCSGPIYRMALAKFHREIFDLAIQSIDRVNSSDRNIQGHTMAVSSEGFLKAQDILNEAIEKIREIGRAEQNGDRVYHLEVALFPFTRQNDDKNQEQK